MNMILTILILITVMTVAAVLLIRQNVKAFLKPRRRLARRDPSHLGIDSWEDVSFQTLDGISLKGWFIPAQPERMGASFIFLHGLGGNRADLLGQAVNVAKRGYGALLFDFRNHGASAGTLTTLGEREVEDVLAAHAYLSSRADVDNARLGIIGHSMGAATAIRAAAHLPKLNFVVAESSFASLEQTFKQTIKVKTRVTPSLLIPLLRFVYKLYTKISVHAVRPIDDLKDIFCPIMFTHGEADNFITPDNSCELFEAAQSVKELRLIAGTKHRSLLGNGFRHFEDDLHRFIDEHLHDVYIQPVQEQARALYLN